MKEKTKDNSPSPPESQNQGPSGVHAEPSHWLHEISISKTVCHHFALG
jgi:hypothetical protein